VTKSSLDLLTDPGQLAKETCTAPILGMPEVSRESG
jgi:hypothetical protein